MRRPLEVRLILKVKVGLCNYLDEVYIVVYQGK